MPTANELNPEDRFVFEKKARDKGFDLVAGLDEAGRGPLAGPVVAAAVVIRDTGFRERIDDSKRLSEKRREKAFLEILDLCDVGIGAVSVGDIDRLNILRATLLAMKRAVLDLPRKPDYLLVDGRMDVPLPTPRTCIVRGETYSLSIACASIAAKVFRDRLMLEADRKYPGYGFKRHKGYGTKDHIEAIKFRGFCPIHRRSFGPFGGKRDSRAGTRG